MARKFLYFIAICIFLVLAVFLALRLFGDDLARVAFVPKTEFVAQKQVETNAYANPDLWFSRPGKANDPSLWRPAPAAPDERGEGMVPDAAAASPDAVTATFPLADAKPAGNAAIFFIHPTSYLSRNSWNAPLDDADANERAELFLRGMASAFNDAGAVWAPRYRQATIGAFLAEDRVTAEKALHAAYQDVAVAFAQFLTEIPKDRPIILAGHSQGALHLTRLLREAVAGKPVSKQIVAAYVVGWPVSVDTDLIALGMPACSRPDQAGCLLSWQSYAEPADPAQVLNAYDATTGFDGRPRKGTAMLCVNPITGTVGGTAEAAANLGTLKPNDDFTSAEVIVGAVPARCDPARGLLMIGDAPDVGGYQLPGNNFHVYDYPLFWMNVRADAARRLAAHNAR